MRTRLAALKPSGPENYCEQFPIVPPALLGKLGRGRVVICSCHALNCETEERIAKQRGVDKRGVTTRSSPAP